jgi:hypothetical protein
MLVSEWDDQILSGHVTFIMSTRILLFFTKSFVLIRSSDDSGCPCLLYDIKTRLCKGLTPVALFHVSRFPGPDGFPFYRQHSGFFSLGSQDRLPYTLFRKLSFLSIRHQPKSLPKMLRLIRRKGRRSSERGGCNSFIFTIARGRAPAPADQIRSVTGNMPYLSSSSGTWILE